MGWLIAFAISLSILVRLFAMASLSGSRGPERISTISIKDCGILKSPANAPVRLFAINNEGHFTVRCQEYYTLYWTNSLGKETNCFRSLGKSMLINPGETNLVKIVSPNGDFWRSSFAFSVEPTKLIRLLHRWPLTSSFVPRDVESKYSEMFIVLGPEIARFLPSTLISFLQNTIF